MENEVKDISDKVRRLQAENDGLRERKTELEGKVAEYELRLGINQPLKEMTLKDYVSKLYDRSTRGKIIDGGKHVLSDAKLVGFEFTDKLLARIKSLGYAMYIDLADEDGKVTRFKRFCSKKDKSKFEELLNPLIGYCPRFTVESYSTSCRFVEGIKQEEGKTLYFDKL